MYVSYSSDELKSLVRILNDILSEARKCRPELSTDDIVQHVFVLADRGERDARKLHEAVFGASTLRVIERARVDSEHKPGVALFQNPARLSPFSRRQSFA